MSLAAAVAAIALLWLARIAWVDFRTLRIPNADVIGLSLLLLVGHGVMAGPAGLIWPLAAGLLLFAIGIGFWTVGLMGGGDAKLLFPVGLLLGWGGLFWFAVMLIPASLLTLLGLWIGNRPNFSGHPLAARVAAIRATRGVPYAVTLFIAVLLAQIAR